MLNNKVFKYKIIIFAPIIMFFVLVGVLSVSAPGYKAYADKQRVFTVEQISDAVYCGRQFVDGSGRFCDTDTNDDGFTNELFYSFRFTIDNLLVEDLSYENVSVVSDQVIMNPQRYLCTFIIDYEGTTYTINSVPFTVQKRIVTVMTLLNGKTNLEVQEGTEVILAYNYQDAVPLHTYQQDYGDYTVTVIDSAYMNCPAWTDVDTTKPIERSRVVADHAESDYYNFKYSASFLTIKETNQNTLKYEDSDGVELVMAGNFSVLHTVQYIDVGVNVSSSEYAVISAKADVLYKDSGFFDKYEKVGCFSVDVFYNNNVIIESTPSTIAVKASDLKSDKKYKVIALYKNGRTEVLDAKYEEGYLSFYSADVGDFIIITEIEGLSMTQYALVIVAGVAVVILVILLFAVFRRKY